MKIKNNIKAFWVFAVLLSLCFNRSSYAQKAADSLLLQFQNPPQSAKPRVWWHWMNGNITKEGIRKDLEWMHRAGIGGFHNFDAGMNTPQVVKERLIYMTPAWKDAFAFTTRLADSLKLEMAIAGSPGWSESGGPWVPASEGMKKFVWSETRLKGGKTFTGNLPKPPSTSGPFQDLPVQPGFGLEGIVKTPPEYYQDVAVLAFRLPQADVALRELKPKVTSSGGSFSLEQLTDGDLSTTQLLPATKSNAPAWIQYEFSKPQLFKAITIVGGGDRGPFGLYGEKLDTRQLETSYDGVNFKHLCYLPAGNVVQQTLNIPPVAAKYFRVSFKNPAPFPAFLLAMGMQEQAEKNLLGHEVAEIVFHTTPRVDSFEEKAGFAAVIGAPVYTNTDTLNTVAAADVIDLTGWLKADGSLTWKVPAGNWTIVRFGYSLTGKQNHPASPEATGLEVDKLDAVAVKNYFDHYLNQYQDATGGLMGHKGGLQYLMMDSWEAGVQNWSRNITEEFQKRRGYSLTSWMPVLIGYVVKSREASDKFLWDFRKTISELTAENHYDQLTALLHERGMKRYTESHESKRVLIADGMDIKRKADIPMAAIWMLDGHNGEGTQYKADIRESASVAHLYGQNLAAAESFTAFGNAWSFSPEKLKPTADLALANGLNRFVIHTSVHQPSDDKVPGLGLAQVGQWFTRHETWAEQAKAWTTYLARNSYMLQQGKFVADVVYYYGEDNNITNLFGDKLPEIPEGYNYDFINADALLNLLTVENRRLVTPSGMSYRVLVLDANSRQMTLSVARKVRDLVKAGAVVVGPKPTGTPSLTDNQKEFQAIVNELWGADNSVKTIGNGRVYGGKSVQEVLTDLKIAPDFEYTKPQQNTQLLYVHRMLPGAEVYWVNNRNDRVEDLEAVFRVTGKEAEIWHPETGKIEKASFSIADDRTKVALHLEPNDAVFVVFRTSTAKTAVAVPKPIEREAMTVAGSWEVRFQANRGAPAQATFDQLNSWTESKNAGIKYFSGTATYSKAILVPSNLLHKESKLWLDLGDVQNLAEVLVNGKSVGVVWKKPFKVDVTNALKPGKNLLEIKVTNLWVNRLIGDQQPGVEEKFTYTTTPFYTADSPLLPSGLLGPVKLLQSQSPNGVTNSAKQ